MVTINDNTRIAIEIIAQTFKLSEQALLHVLKSLTKLLKNNEQPPEDYILDENTKVGKQKISELIKKHNKDGGRFGILWFIDLFLLSGRVDYKNALFSARTATNNVNNVNTVQVNIDPNRGSATSLSS